MSVLLNCSTPNQALACLFAYNENQLRASTLVAAKECDIFAIFEHNSAILIES
jgi:hypothetical protein